MLRPDLPVWEQLSPEEQRRVTRAALLRPLHLLVAAIGTAFTAMTLAWWVLPITLVTYFALVYLAARDPLFQRRILRGRESLSETSPALSRGRKTSIQQRTRKLSDEEFRRKIEVALTDKDRTLVAIESSDEATRGLLHEAPPKLELLLERLVDVSEKREQIIRSVKPTSDGMQHEARNALSKQEEEEELQTIDAQLSNTFEKISALRPQVLRISTENDEAAGELVGGLITDLDEMLKHLEALTSGTSLS